MSTFCTSPNSDTNWEVASIREGPDTYKILQLFIWFAVNKCHLEGISITWTPCSRVQGNRLVTWQSPWQRQGRIREQVQLDRAWFGSWKLRLANQVYSSASYWQTYYSDIFTFISLLCEIRTTWKQITINQTTQRAPPLIAVWTNLSSTSDVDFEGQKYVIDT